MRLYDQSILPDRMRNEQSRNTYYFLPFLFGMLGLIWHFYRRTTDAWVVFSLFIMLGIAIILYSNQPPNEPRERDYAIAGSILMFAVWIGMGVTALYDIFTRKTKIGSLPAGLLAVGLVATAPLVMLTQNWDDHSRAGHYASRDYASNFLNSCQPNAIIFTYGDNDTYPLWYAQEVENIRTDVRVVNLSLLAVDWYIDQLRRKMNQSPAIAMTIPSAQYRGNKRNQIYHYAPSGDQPMSIQDAVKFMANDHPLQGSEQEIETYLPSNNLFIPVDSAAARKSGAVFAKDSTVAQINFKITKPAIYKDEMAILDILASNLWSRPIYFAVTCTPDKLLGLGEYLQMEGMALRVVPIKSKGRAEFGGMLGGGRVATNIMYDNVMNKFKWGGAFNTKRTFIDKSYFPSVVSIRIAMLRLADELLAQGDADRAVKVVDKYFEAFPNYNFQYDNYTAYFLRIYADAAGLGDASNSIVQANPALKAKLEQFDGKAATLDKFKKQLEVLATEISTMRKFYANPAVAMYYNNDLKQIDGETRGNQVRMGLRDQIIQMADDTRDAAYAQKIKAMFGK